MDSRTILNENQIKYILSKNHKLSAVMNNINKTKIDSENLPANSSSTNISVNELGKLLLNYSKEGNVEKIIKLIQEGAPFISDWLGMSALHFAAIYNNKEVLELLLRSGLNKDTRTKVDRTALHLAAYHGHKDIVEVLLKVDSEVNARDMLKMTPLHWAVERRHNDVAKALLKHGADVDAMCKFGKTPLSIAIQSGQTELLKELQNAREIMRSRPQITDQIQNETNAAVNSIIFNDDEDSNLYVDKNDISKDIRVKIETKKVADSHVKLSTLHVLKKLKSMMSDDDADDTLFKSALQGGRKLVLTEGGKLALNDAKLKQSLNVVNDLNRKGNYDIEKVKKTIVMKPGHLQLKPTNKNVKIISIDAFKKICGSNTFNSTTNLTRITNINEINGKKPVLFNKIVSSNNANTINQNNSFPSIKKEIQDDDLSSIIEICPEIDSDQEQNTISSNISEIDISDKTSRICEEPVSSKKSFSPSKVELTRAFNSNLNSTIITTNKSNVVQLLDIPEICRQLQELKRSHDALRKELELTRIENEEYKMRLERLECKFDEQQNV